MLKVLVSLLLLCQIETSKAVDDLDLMDLDDAAILNEELTSEFDMTEVEDQSSATLAEDFDIEDLELEEIAEDKPLEEELEKELEKEEDEKPVERVATQPVVTQPVATELNEKKIEITDPNEINFEVINEISEAQKQNIVDIINSRERANANKIRYSSAQIEALRIQLTDISKSPLKTVYVPKGTKVYRLKDGKFFYLPKGIYTKAHIKTDFDQRRYLVNDEKQITYSVGLKEVTYIDHITDLYRKPHTFKRLKPKKKVNLYDDDFKYTFAIDLGLGFNNPEFTQNIVDDARSFAPQFSAGMGLLANLKLDYQIGFTTMYENVIGQIDSGGLYQLRSFSVGPIFKTKKFWTDYRLAVEGRLSLYSQMNIDDGFDITNYALSENTFMLSLEREKVTAKYGVFVYGYQIQRKWFNAAASGDNGVDLNPRARHNDSFGFFVGHRSDWIW